MGIVITAGIMIVRKDHKILICHPTNHDPNFWSISKGKVDDGESLWETAIRETYEETNIMIPNDVKKYKQDRVTFKHKKKAIHIYIVREDENDFNIDDFDIKCNSNVEPEIGGFPEMDDFKWVTISEARRLVHYSQLPSLDVVEEQNKNKR